MLNRSNKVDVNMMKYCAEHWEEGGGIGAFSNDWYCSERHEFATEKEAKAFVREHGKGWKYKVRED